MAETVTVAAVAAVANYLTSLLGEKMRLLGGVGQEMQQVIDKLESIRAMLKDADGRQQSQSATKTWINHARNLAYDIEDIVDEFLLQMERTRIPAAGLSAGVILSSPARFIRQMVARNRIAGKICRVNSRLQSICDFNVLAPPLLQNDGGSSSTQNPRLVAPLFLEESQIVGIGKPKEDLITLLIDGGEIDRKVVSVVGMGGVGKTTLARKVMEDPSIRRHFACSAWITVSQTYRVEDLLKTMLIELIQTSAHVSLRGDVKSMNHTHLFQTAKEFLHDKRYFIVLDDVWSSIAWDDLQHAFPHNSLQSRVMVTTRRHCVAKYCSANSETHVYELRPLSEEDAWALLCKIAYNNQPCPSGLENRLERIFKMCGRLPLAIVTLGGFLLTKNPNEWDKIHINLCLETDQKDDMFRRLTQVIWLSYGDLPHELKSCLLYFGMYPEDYTIRRGQLIRAWIAEGFVMSKSGETLEQIAEGYLNELVHRSLVEVVQFNSYGRVYNCRVHDVIRELILSIAREQNFLEAYSSDSDQLHDEVRRLSITMSDIKRSFPKVRTVFMLCSSCELSVLSKFKMLRVLNLSGAALKTFPNEVSNLHHLKYLNMRNTDVKEIPKTIGKLRLLRTLDLKHTYVSRLPNEILQLLHIRHILVYRFNFDRSVSVANGVEMPTRLKGLKCLQKLGTLQLDGSVEQARELGELTQLRTLGISSGQGQDWSILQTSIKKMKSIDTLWINTGYHASDKPLDVKFLSELSSLRSIILRGPLQELSSLSGSYFASLVKIALISSKLRCDLLQTFEKLPNLTYLALENAYDGEELQSTKEGFPKLRRLIIKALNKLKFVYIDISAMPELRELRIIECPILESVPRGIERLTKLKELNLGEMPQEFVRKIRDKGEDREKVRSISSIWHLYVTNGTWNTERLN